MHFWKPVLKICDSLHHEFFTLKFLDQLNVLVQLQRSLLFSFLLLFPYSLYLVWKFLLSSIMPNSISILHVCSTPFLLLDSYSDSICCSKMNNPQMSQVGSVKNDRLSIPSQPPLSPHFVLHLTTSNLALIISSCLVFIC